MRFTVDGVGHEFDEDKLTFGEGRALEKVTGHPFGEIGAHAAKGELTVVQAFIWIALKRDQPTLGFSDLDDRSISDFEFAEAEEETDPASPTDGDAGLTSVA